MLGIWGRRSDKRQGLVGRFQIVDYRLSIGDLEEVTHLGSLCSIARWAYGASRVVRPNKADVILSGAKDLQHWIRFFGFGKQASE